ncbi:MAG: hypothetical protein HY337_10125, partial [Gemmatimonadetes bacterium]|nr:hypothetical protein [Gemmatimonadota bacterium]
ICITPLQVHIDRLQAYMGLMSIRISLLQVRIGRLQACIGLMSIHITLLETCIGCLQIDMRVMSIDITLLQTCTRRLQIDITPMPIDMTAMSIDVTPLQDPSRAAWAFMRQAVVAIAFRQIDPSIAPTVSDALLQSVFQASVGCRSSLRRDTSARVIHRTARGSRRMVFQPSQPL